MSLCRYCKNVFDHWHLIQDDFKLKGFLHHKTIFDLDSSAKSGCPLCIQWIQNLKQFGHDAYERFREATKKALEQKQPLERSYVHASDVFFDHIGAGDRNCLVLQLTFRFLDSNVEVDNGSKGSTVSLPKEDPNKREDPRDEDDTEDSNLIFAPIPRNTVFPDFIWGKVEMLPVVDHEPTPSRTFQVPRKSEDSMWQAQKWLQNCCKEHTACSSTYRVLPTRLVFIGKEKPKLCITSELDFQPKYATVSHCWGTLRLRNLTKEALEQFRSEIPPESLSTTFRDSFAIARALGIEYVWIDSLCIIQNDKEDWRKESALMSSVYGGSTVTIAATSAENGNRGCLLNRDPDYLFRHLLQVNVGDRIQLYNCVAPQFYAQGLGLTPLGRRAWVVQERFLSPRTLHFTSSQLFWECNETVACEIYPEHVPDVLCYSDKFIAKCPVTIDIWAQIVFHYTYCNLTEITDILVAISGLARRIHDKTNDTYLAGHWRKDLEIQLCWKGQGVGIKPPVYLGPSWSWAGNNSRFCGYLTRNDFTNFELFIHITDAYTVPVTEANVFGEVSGGSVRLQCQFLVLGIPSDGNETYSYKIAFCDVSIGAAVCYDFEKPPQNELYFLPIINAIDEETILGIVLLPTEKRGQYYRVGQFETLPWEYNKCIEEGFVHQKCQATDLNYIDALDDDGKQLKVIEII